MLQYIASQIACTFLVLVVNKVIRHFVPEMANGSFIGTMNIPIPHPVTYINDFFALKTLIKANGMDFSPPLKFLGIF